MEVIFTSVRLYIPGLGLGIQLRKWDDYDCVAP